MVALDWYHSGPPLGHRGECETFFALEAVRNFEKLLLSASYVQATNSADRTLQFIFYPEGMVVCVGVTPANKTLLICVPQGTKHGKSVFCE